MFKIKKSSCLLAFFDFAKAFDKLNWTFVQQTLEKFNLGENFRKWVRIIYMYTNVESCIINNTFHLSPV